jgi:hypothetical protein
MAARVQVEEDGRGRRINLIEGAEMMMKLDERVLARKRRRAKKIGRQWRRYGSGRRRRQMQNEMHRKVYKRFKAPHK